MLPLSFAEYLLFRGYERDGDSPGLARGTNGHVSLVSDLLRDYRRYGGLPLLATTPPDLASHRDYLRYDIRGKALLKTNGKRYVADMGLWSYLGGYRNADWGRSLENVVYLRLRHDGWDVSVGMLRAGEVDFVARRGDELMYVQVTENMDDPVTRKRELGPLRAVRDAYPKLVVVGTGEHPTVVDGIRIVSVTDFLLT